MNTLILCGNLGGNAEQFKFANGNMKYSFSMATTDGYTNAEGQYIKNTEWHKVETIVSAKASANLHKYYVDNLVTGSRVEVKGMKRTSKYQDKQGIDRAKHYCSVEYSNGGTIDIQNRNGNQNNQDSSDTPDIKDEDTKEDIPFLYSVVHKH